MTVPEAEAKFGKMPAGGWGAWNASQGQKAAPAAPKPAGSPAKKPSGILGASPAAPQQHAPQFNSSGQSINIGHALTRHGKEGRMAAGPAPTGDGGRAASDFQKSQQMSESAQLKRGLEAENAQQNMQEQAMHAELVKMAMSAQAQKTSQMAQRQSSQIGLASQLQQALMSHRNALMQALMT